MKTQLTGMSMNQLTNWVTAQGEPAFRARQLNDWLKKGAHFEDMRNLPASLIEKIKSLASAQAARVIERHGSKLDGTEKLLFGLEDGHTVEGVIMRYHHGISFCLSTQVGCAMGCAFCASTLNGKLRDLTAGEMASMCYLANRMVSPSAIGNLVLMGSGEPLDNTKEVFAFLHHITSTDSLNIGARHISLSTCGLPDQMHRLAQEGLQITLSVSLHGPNDEIRQQIMPIARVHTIDAVLDACRYYIQKTGRRVVFEYALIQDINDSLDNAQELAKRLRGMQCHVNLIPLNDVKERSLRASTKVQVERFLNCLKALNISATVRRQLGDDIFGACGQLRAQRLKTQLSEEGSQ